MRAKSLLRTDVIIGLALAPIGAAIAAEGLKLGYYDPFGTLGAGFFPFWIGIALAVSGPLMSGIALTSGGAGRERPSGAQLGALALLIAYAASIWAAGFLPASAAYFAVALGVVARLRWPLVALVTVISCALLWLIFERWLSIPLPHGVLEKVWPQ